MVNHSGASSNKRPIPRWSILRRNVSLARSPASLLITSRGIQQPSGHRITPQNLTSPLYLPLSTYILVEHPPLHYAQRLDWVRGHDMPRDKYASLTFRAALTNCLSIVRHDGVLACATPRYISRQTQTAWCRGAALPDTVRYLPAQHRHSSVDSHEGVRAAVLHQLSSAVRRDARMLHLTFGID